MPFSDEQRNKAKLMEMFIKEEGGTHFWVPSSKTLRILMINPNKEFNPKDYYEVSVGEGKMHEKFHCPCDWGSFREGRDEPNGKYCVHVLAVLYRLIKKGILPEFWKGILSEE